MKVEDTDDKTLMDFREHSGQKSQVHSKEVTYVLLAGVAEPLPIVKGTFHYYVTRSIQKPMPFCQFDTLAIGRPGSDEVTRIEVPVTQIAGVAYYVKDTRNDD